MIPTFIDDRGNHIKKLRCCCCLDVFKSSWLLPERFLDADFFAEVYILTQLRKIVQVVVMIFKEDEEERGL